MLFISPHPGYVLTGCNQQLVRDPSTGAVVDSHGGIDIEFIHGGAPAWAADIALSNPTFRKLWGGLPDGIDYRTYIASYDTVKMQHNKGWSDDVRETVESFLLAHPDCGSRYLHVESAEETDSPPWPTYDQTHHFKIAIAAEDIGVDLAYTLEYERGHKNRPAVVKALEEKIAGGAGELVAA